MKQKFINYVLAASIPGLDAREAGLLYDHSVKDPTFGSFIDEMRSQNLWAATGEKTHTATG